MVSKFKVKDRVHVVRGKIYGWVANVRYDDVGAPIIAVLLENPPGEENFYVAREYELKMEW